MCTLLTVYVTYGVVVEGSQDVSFQTCEIAYLLWTEAQHE